MRTLVNMDLDLDNQLPTLLSMLRELLKDDRRCIRKDDEFLTIFLRVRGYDVNRAGASVCDFYHNMERNHDLLHGIRPSNFMPVYELNFSVILRVRATGTGSRVGLGNIWAWDTSKCSLRSLQQSSTLQVMSGLQEKETQLHGVVLIFDLEGLNLSHVMQITPKEIYRMLICIQGGLPLKVTAIHLINYPPIFFGVWFLARRFLKAKIRKRVHFHRTLESLHEYFDKEMLPETLGGPLDMSSAIDQEFMEKLLEEDKYAEDLYS